MKKVKKKITSHMRRANKVREVANGCWWIECYLNDRCGIRKS